MFDLRDFSTIQMKVGAADGGSGHPKNDVIGFNKGWILDRIDSDVVSAVVGEGSHVHSSCFG
ncbi:hypothetical protein D3C78_1912580 [compost metagenome]